MFDTADNADPIDRIVAHADEVLFADKSCKRFPGGSLATGINLLLAANKCLGSESERMINALIELTRCELESNGGERYEDAMAEFEDASGEVYVIHRGRFEGNAA